MTIVERTLTAIAKSGSPHISEAVRARWNSLTKPRGSLGRIETDIEKLAQIQNAVPPHIDNPAIYVFCADHGITDEGVSPYPSVVTREMVKNFLNGGAAINVLCRHFGISTLVIDAGVAGPAIDGVLNRRIADGTRNFRRGPAMHRSEAMAALESGIELAHDASKQFDVVGIGEMGIGNSTSASALACAFLGIDPQQAVGRGAGLDDAGLHHKSSVVSEALALHREIIQTGDPVAILATLGGFEIVMMAGFLLGAAASRLPVVVDGFICGAAFLAARTLYPSIGQHVFLAHRSAEPGHKFLFDAVDSKPILDLNMRLGEGTGAALAISILRAGLRLYREMATFEEASVSDSKETKE